MDKLLAAVRELNQRLPFKALLHLCAGALPGSPGADFVATFPERQKEAKALGLDEKTFFEMSPAGLRAAVQQRAEYDSALKISREMLAESGHGRETIEPLAGVIIIDESHRRHLEMLGSFLPKLGIESFLGENCGLGRTSLMDYKAGRIRGKVSQTKRELIEAAIRRSAKLHPQ